ncbi:MAG TPA: adenosylcobinamide-phosphate synthase CbiB [Nitrospiraceae bacterium]|nr:adenosylcobinamide-phosphate synthase CbiB [Nitrospiraceae bacterium]
MIAGELLLVYVLDAVLGDPRWLPHPVRLIGWMIAWYENRVRCIVQGPIGERMAGIVLALGMPTLAYTGGWLTIELAGRAHMLLGVVAWVLLAWTTLAARDLADQALAVRHAMEQGSLQQARRAVAQIVGRDTAQLSESEVVRAAVETVAESTSDGVIAPLFFLTLGGPPAALAYKAINTLDSMVGHPEEKYRHLGWASARLDDVANWVPARITALLLVLAAGVVSRSIGTMRQAWRILLRDGHKHPSPNSGRPEAAMAGALQVQLGGTNLYGGRVEQRLYLGDPHVPLRQSHITEAVTLMWMTAFLGVVLAMGLLVL